VWYISCTRRLTLSFVVNERRRNKVVVPEGVDGLIINEINANFQELIGSGVEVSARLVLGTLD
jgi:uncharacterized membrane protein YecN with MAPEG domain